MPHRTTRRAATPATFSSFKTLAALAILSASTLLATPAVAQSRSTDAPLRIGILLGANSATLGGSDAEDSRRRTALLGGVYLVRSLGDRFSLRPELLYSQKGAKGTMLDDEGGSSTDVGFELSYIDVPVLLQLDLGTSGAARPHLYAGPSFGFKVDCSLTGSQGPVEVSLDCDDDEFELESFDLGAVIGGGVRVGFGALQGTVGARYQHGLSNLTSDSKVQNRVISVYGSVEFGRR
jgi:hypothetical protein